MEVDRDVNMAQGWNDYLSKRCASPNLANDLWLIVRRCDDPGKQLIQEMLCLPVP